MNASILRVVNRCWGSAVRVSSQNFADCQLGDKESTGAGNWQGVGVGFGRLIDDLQSREALKHV